MAAMTRFDKIVLGLTAAFLVVITIIIAGSDEFRNSWEGTTWPP